MALIDEKYHNLSNAIVNAGYDYLDESRGTICRQLSSANLEIGLTQEFPLLTTKKMHTKSIVAELIWFLRGGDNIKYLLDNGVSIWNKDAYNHYIRIASANLDKSANDIYYDNEDGTLRMFSFKEFCDVMKGNHIPRWDTYILGDVGRNYGIQWRNWRGITKQKGVVTHTTAVDQIADLLANLKERPINRRNIVTAWNPAEIKETALPSCHWAFEVIPFPLKDYQRIDLSGFEDTKEVEKLHSDAVDGDEEASKVLDTLLEGIPTIGLILKWHQRSVDTFLGLPFNIASYALLAHIIEGLTGYKAMGIIGDLSNVHFYEPHIELISKQVLNDPKKYKGCKIEFSEKVNENFSKFRNGSITFDQFIKDFEVEDVKFIDYQSYESIKGEMLAPNT